MRSFIITLVFAVFIVPGVAVGQDSGSAPKPTSPDELEEKSSDESEEAQQADKPPKKSPFVGETLETTAPDYGYGTQTPNVGERFPDPADQYPMVDRRGEESVFANRNVATPMAHTSKQGDFHYTNYNIMVNYLSYGVTDDLTMTAGIIFPTSNGDLVTTFAGKYRVHHDRNVVVSVQPFFGYANGVQTLDTQQYGLGVGLLNDFLVSDTVVLNLSAYGYGTVAYGYDFNDVSGCGSRSEYLEGDCVTVATDHEAFPSGGHWIAASAGLNWFFDENFSLDLELITGGVWGTFFGTESVRAEDDERIDPKQEGYEDGDFEFGVPYRRNFTGSAAISWTTDNAGLQLAFFLLEGEDNPNTTFVDEGAQPLIVPSLSASFRF